MVKDGTCHAEDSNLLCIKQSYLIINLIEKCNTLQKQRDFFKEELEKTQRRIREEHTFTFGDTRYRVAKVGVTSEK